MAAIVIEILNGGVAAWVAWTSLVLTAAAISLAAARTVKNAVAIGADVDVDNMTPAHEVVARSIGHDHVLCLCAIAAVLIVQLTA